MSKMSKTLDFLKKHKALAVKFSEWLGTLSFGVVLFFVGKYVVIAIWGAVTKYQAQLWAFIQLLERHPLVVVAVMTWIGKYGVTAFVGAFPAPTKEASKFYVFCFKFGNGLVGNVQRAGSTKLENSPNWHDAVENVKKEECLIPAK